jgi:hypothetical protein
VRNFLCGHSKEVCSGAARKLRSTRKIKQWWRWRGRELVNSKKQRSPPYKAS